MDQLLLLASLDSPEKLACISGDPGSAYPNSGIPAQESATHPARWPRWGVRWEKFLWAVTDRRLWWGRRHTPIYLDSQGLGPSQVRESHVAFPLPWACASLRAVLGAESGGKLKCYGRKRGSCGRKPLYRLEERHLS